MDKDFLSVNHKRTKCHIKPILSGRVLPNERAIGRMTTPDWLAEWDKKQMDKLAILRKQIRAKRDEAFNNSLFGNLESQIKAQARVDAYDVALGLINKVLGGK